MNQDLKKTFEAPEERNINFRETHCAHSELKNFLEHRKL